ncbi:hypothetical protein V494_03673 [Pseudogymnoascus sp. VKM F-4513 (FW-928)]|nr:hypothetical protein V494_03673 [Pseudogymnoascus sp. VKM F-4513 (FW-928)]
MDPLSIASSASGIATLCGTIIMHVSKFVIDSLAVRQSIEDFNENIKVLKDVLYEVDQTAKKCPKSLPSSQKEELDHWEKIHDVLEACRGSTERLKSELPEPFQEGKTVSMIHSQLKMCLKSSIITQIRGDINLYIQALQISLTTMNLVSTWDSQQLQHTLIFEIEKLKKAVAGIKNMRQQEQQTLVRERSTLNSDDDLTLLETEAEGEANKNIVAWIKSAEHLVASLYQPDEESRANREDIINRSNPNDPATVDDNNGTEVVGNLPSLIEPRHRSRDDGYQDSGIGISDNGSGLVPRRESKNWLNPEIVLYQIAELQKDVSDSLNSGSYSEAERHQIKVIEKRDLLEKTQNIPFSDRPDAEETLADIYMQQRASTSPTQARIILWQLLEQERNKSPESNDNMRKSRLCHKLALVHVDLGLSHEAEEYATEALNLRQNSDSTPTLIVESAYLLAKVCDSNGRLPEARGLKKWVEGKYPELLEKGTSISTVRTNDTAPNPSTDENAHQWCKDTGFDVDSEDFRYHRRNADGKTPVHLAVVQNNWKILQQMVDRVVDRVATLETTDSDDCTALLLACSKLNRRTTKVLLDHGARTDVHDRYLNSPLHRVQSSKGGIEVAKLLLAHGVDIDARNCFNKTALHLACELENMAMVSLLIEHNADINCHGPRGFTPLHVAIDSRRPSIVKILLDKGADRTLLDADNRDAVTVARETTRRSPEIQAMLVNYVAEPGQRESQSSRSSR